jgi:thymidine kinase
MINPSLSRTLSMKKTKGLLEVICGSMFSGKSEELVRRLRRAEYAQQVVKAFKPRLDNRYDLHALTSHSGDVFGALPIERPEELLKHITPHTNVIGIDEIQFFTPSIVSLICTLIDQDKRVIVAGLDLDFRGLPFGCVPTLMALADQVTKLKAICIACGADAHFTQRMVNGQPARYDDPVILVGAQEAYQARCRECHIIDKKPLFTIQEK